MESSLRFPTFVGTDCSFFQSISVSQTRELVSTFLLRYKSFKILRISPDFSSGFAVKSPAVLAHFAVIIKSSTLDVCFYKIPGATGKPHMFVTLSTIDQTMCNVVTSIKERTKLVSAVCQIVQIYYSA